MAASLFDVTFGALTLQQCSSVEFSPNNTILPAYASADVAPSAFYVMRGEPRGRFTSLDVETILAGIDEAVGLKVASGTIALPFKVRANGATYASGSNHIKLAATDGQLIPLSLGVQQDQLASVNLEAILLSTDGYTAPVSYSGSQALGSPAHNADFRLGPTSLNGTTITGVTGWTVNYGITTDIRVTDGEVYPRVIYITRVDPTIDITLENEALVNTYGPQFAAATAAVLSLVKNADGGSIVALTSLEHIRITAAAGIYDWQNVGASGVEVAQPTLRLMTKSLTIATSQALSA